MSVMVDDLVQRGYCKSTLHRQLADLPYNAETRLTKLREAQQRVFGCNRRKADDRIHLIVLPYSRSTRMLNFKRICRKHISHFMSSDASRELRLDTWPVLVAYKAFPNMFLENYRLNAPVDVGGRDFL